MIDEINVQTHKRNTSIGRDGPQNMFDESLEPKSNRAALVLFLKFEDP